MMLGVVPLNYYVLTCSVTSEHVHSQGLFIIFMSDVGKGVTVFGSFCFYRLN